jgi:hypothetical protein
VTVPKNRAYLIHVFDIKAPPELLFGSITTADGLSAWCTTKVEADNAEGVGGHDAWAQPLSASNSTDLTEERWGASGTRWERIHPTMPSRQPISTRGTASTACAILCETGQGKPYQSGAPARHPSASPPVGPRCRTLVRQPGRVPGTDKCEPTHTVDPDLERFVAKPHECQNH